MDRVEQPKDQVTALLAQAGSQTPPDGMFRLAVILLQHTQKTALSEIRRLNEQMLLN